MVKSTVAAKEWLNDIKAKIDWNNITAAISNNLQLLNMLHKGQGNRTPRVLVSPMCLLFIMVVICYVI